MHFLLVHALGNPQNPNNHFARKNIRCLKLIDYTDLNSQKYPGYLHMSFFVKFDLKKQKQILISFQNEPNYEDGKRL